MSKKSLKVTSIVSCIAIAILTLVFASLGSLRASAVSETDYTKKALLNGLRTCYSSAYTTDGPVIGSEFRAYGIDTILTDAGKTDQIINVATQVGNSIKNSQITCQEVFSGANSKSRGKISGLLSLYGKNTDNITYFGYEKSDVKSGSKQGCIMVKYADASNTTHTTDNICFKLDAYNKFVNPYGENVITEKEDSGGPVKMWYDGSTGALKLTVDGATNAWNPQTIAWAGNGEAWSQFVSQAEQTLAYGEESCRGGDGFCRPIDDAWNYGKDGIEPVGLGYRYISVKIGANEGEVYEEYMKRGKDAASLRALRYIAGPNAHWDNDVVKFTKDEAYNLYDIYFQRFKADQKVFVDNECYSKAEKDKATAGSGYAVYNGSGKWCGVRINSTTDADNEMYNVVNSSFNGLTPVNIKTILEKMTAWEFSYVEDPENPPKPGVTPGDGGENGNGGGDSDDASCFSDAASLGWILCPVLKFVGAAADTIYGYIENNWLIIDADDMKVQDQGAYLGWSYFRNVANIIFSIFLLIVILSQLTGLGISNYGIKKMLPKLIVMAILVNISFFICQFAVDVSNIVGASIKSLFESLKTGSGSTFSFSSMIGGLFATIGIGGIGTGAAIAIATNATSVGAWLIPLLLAVLTAIISILFFFIILAVRKAGVLILVILAPVAIICYTFPNTKKFFDRWVKLFTSLLVLYPICGLLMGGGKFVSNLLLKSDANGFINVLVAMLLQVVPFFFVPTLLKSSLAAAGNIGNKISNIGNKVGRGLSGAIGSADATKRASNRLDVWGSTHGREMLNRANQRLRNNRIVGRAVRGVEDSRAGRALGAAYKRNNDRKAAEAWAKYRKTRLEDTQAALDAANMDPASIENAEASLRVKQMERLVSEDMDALITGDELDTTDVFKIESAFKAALAAVDADPTDESKMIRAKALASLLMGKGDTGQSKMLEALHDRVRSTTGIGSAGSEAMRSLAGFVSYNDKWMGSIKGSDTGSYQFINDLASSQGIKSDGAYAMAAANKFTQSTIGSAGDSWYNSIDAALRNNEFNSVEGRKALSAYADMATKALTDPRTANSIKGERLKTLNEIRKTEYDLHKKDWLSANPGRNDADYEREFGKFQRIERPGDELKIVHQKAPVPTGFTESGVWIGGGSGPTKQQQIAYEEWAKHSAEVDRKNS